MKQRHRRDGDGSATPRTSQSTKNSVQVLVEAGRHSGVSRRDVARLGRAMLMALELQKSELSILLTDDDKIQRLNRLYRNIDRPTDVLSFSQRQEGDPGDASGALLGDVVISIPTANRQASERGLEVMVEVARLLAHGLLHLLGWDHQTPADDRRMRRETDRLCTAAATTSQGARIAPVARETTGGGNGQSQRGPAKGVK
jgi:probable rRNA maturation factor